MQKFSENIAKADGDFYQTAKNTFRMWHGSL